MSELVKRTLSGIVYVAVVISCIVLHPLSTQPLFLALTLLAVREYHRLMQSGTWISVGSMAIAACLFMSHAGAHPVFWELLFAIGLIVMLAAELFRKAQNPMQNWGNILISVVMLALPLSLTNDILSMGEWSLYRWVLLAVFACIWSNDSGAYCVGTLVGKHKMFPRVSPGKTWEGLAGGFVFSLIAGFVFAMFVPTIPMWEWLMIAFTISIFATIGDLMESLLKRTLGVKDSGCFMPGHGGVLDRFDSVLLCLPAVYLLLKILSNL